MTAASGLVLSSSTSCEPKTVELLEQLLLQGEGDPVISEREIYRRAHREGVINRDLYQRLEDLYSKRNRVLHRYIISDISTYEVFQIAVAFEQILPEVTAAVGILEARQEELGVGMSKSGEMPGLGRRLGEMSAEKHGHPTLAWAFTKSGT